MPDFSQEEWEWSKQDLSEDLFLKFAKIEEVSFSFAIRTEALEIPRRFLSWFIPVYWPGGEETEMCVRE